MPSPPTSRRGSPSRRGGGAPSGHDEDYVDDMTCGIYMQQFMDEWHYRALHCNLAFSCDRVEMIIKALDLFETYGLDLHDEEKIVMAEMEEDDMIQAIVAKMSPEFRKTIEHFMLQLQLVLSTATRIRNVLEEGTNDEVAKVMEDGDMGIAQQILKEVVIEAGREVGELIEVHEGWSTSMDLRVQRLVTCAASAGSDADELTCVNLQLNIFRTCQTSKAMKVLSAMVVSQDVAMKRLVIAGWRAWSANEKSEQAVHDKYKELLGCVAEESKTWKEEQKDLAMGFLVNRFDSQRDEFISQVLTVWLTAAGQQKNERHMDKELQVAQERLNSMQDAQKSTAKGALLRLASGTDSGIMAIAWQGWVAAIKDSSEERDVEMQIKHAETSLRNRQREVAIAAKAAIMRLAVQNDGFSLTQCFTMWVSSVLKGKNLCAVERSLADQKERLQRVKGSRKQLALDGMERLNEQATDLLMMQVFMNWSSEARLGKVIRHYTGKMDTKKQQLEAVQHMFRSFAAQLEQGMSSPRSHRKAKQQAANEGMSRPPQLPA